VNLTVNGVRCAIAAHPLTPLLHVLRGELELTSPKAGCQTGGCGACSVIVDGAAYRSCLLPVAAVEEASVVTVEGLGTPFELAPIQQAWIHHYAAQCGFCTSGLMMAAVAYIDHGGSDDPSAIQEALGGHICRCTGYVKIIDAVAATIRGERFDTARTAPGQRTTIRGVTP
jgi:aerobic-type carbon monoxide dehydrogenase small subunit (CoxS/CutS family)